MSSTTNGEWGELQISHFSREKGLISRKFYDILDNDIKPTEYDEYCGTSHNRKNHRHLRHVCAAILNYLKHNNASDNNTDEFSICKLLNYWAYSTLNGFYHSKGKSEVDNAYKELEKLWNERVNDSSSVHYYKKCKPDRVLFDYDDWKQRKELYDYYVDILPISKSPKIYIEDCDQYYKYIKYKKKIYDQYEKFCKNPYSTQCPSSFEEFKNYNPQDILPKLICYDDMKKKEETEAVVHEDSRTFTTLINAENTNPSIRTGTKAGNALIGVVVTSMTSGVLYKFTPLGTILRNAFGWKNNNMSNINGGDNGLYDYASESFNAYSGEEHYIGYQPS